MTVIAILTAPCICAAAEKKRPAVGRTKTGAPAGLGGLQHTLAHDGLQGGLRRIRRGPSRRNQAVHRIYRNYPSFQKTISVIYEQFLHSESQGDGKNKAKEKGAYYTPVHLVNFVLDELESRKSLSSEGAVLDTACGSGLSPHDRASLVRTRFIAPR